MSWLQIRTLYGMRALAVLSACTLIFAFGLHAVDTHHIHSGHDESEHHESSAGVFYSLDEYAHMSEKKLFLLVMSVLLFSYVVVCAHRELLTRGLVLAHASAHRLRERTCRITVFWEQYLFSQGILHPKPY